MNDTLAQIFRSGEVTDADRKTYPHASASITWETGTLLYNFVRANKPRSTLEVGMAYGISTLFICQAHRDNGGGTHTAIDPAQERLFRSIGLLNIERANLKDLLCFHQVRSDEILPMLCTQNTRVDFAFIDGSHLFDFALVDFHYIDRLLPIGGCVAFDDLWMPGVRKVVSFVLKNAPYKLTLPPSAPNVPMGKRLGRAARRMAQNPLGLDWKLKCVPHNIAFLEKVASDTRGWRFHRAF